MKKETIGVLNKGIDGRDEYLLISDNEDDLDLNEVHRILVEQFYVDSSVPGGYFCHTVRIIPDELHPNRCIAIVQHRYDV